MSKHDDTFEEGEEAAPPGVRVMAVLRWALVAAMALLALFAVLHYAGVFRGAAGPGDVQYYCPMHPSVVQDQPGECPICSMTLVPRTVGGEGGQQASSMPASGPASMPASQPSSVPGLAPVDLTPERIQLIGMRTEQVRRGRLASELRTVGYVAAPEDRVARVHTRFAGWIEQLNVDQTGQRVKKDQVLAAIYSPELLTAQQDYLTALGWKRSDGAPQTERTVTDLTPGFIEDARRRLELLGISKQEIAQLEQTRTPVRALPIRSPASGYVTDKRALQGAYVEPGTQLFEIADLSAVWLIAEIYDPEGVKLGAKAKLELAGGRVFEGRVAFRYPVVDPQTRTTRVRLEIANPGLDLLPGIYGDVTIERDGAEGLIVSKEAIVDAGRAEYVFVALAGGRFEPREVKIGFRGTTEVEVTQGLAEGDTVVTTGNFLIDSESRLRAAIEGIGASSAPSSASGQGPSCDTDFDRARYGDKYRQCRACEVQHRGMGTMEEDCKNAIAKPWR